MAVYVCRTVRFSCSCTEEFLKQFKKSSRIPNMDANCQAVERDLKIKQDKVFELASQGLYDSAELLETERLQKLVELYGEEDNRTMESIQNLSALCITLGHTDKGDELLDRVITLRTKVQGEKHPDTLFAKATRVGNLCTLGRVLEAELLGSALVKTCKENLRSDDAAILRAMSNLAFVYVSKDDYDNAEKLFSEIIRIQRQTKPCDIDTVNSMEHLSGIYVFQKRWADASALLERVLNIRQRTLGMEHERTIAAARLLEQAYKKSERWRDVQRVQLLIFNAMKMTLGEENDKTLDVMKALVSTYSYLHAWEKCSEMIQGIIEVNKRQVPSGDPELLKMRCYLEAMRNMPSNYIFSEPTAVPFIYRPLDPKTREIRLVCLQKSCPGQGLRASLFHRTLDNPPSYEALSYVWGVNQQSGFLDLDGHLVAITENLGAALLRLQSGTHDRLLWIDAICIDQANLEERSAQVQLMRDIYRNAKRTIIWLGVAGDESDVAMKFLTDLRAHYAPIDLMRSVITNGQGHSLCNALEQLFKHREYWNRLWVIQEVVCAKDVLVHCGRYSVGYNAMENLRFTLSLALRTLGNCPSKERYQRLADSLVFRGPAKIGRPLAHQGAGEMEPLLILLLNHRSTNCTDPRDRIYALTGISRLRNSSHPGLKADYSKSVSEVYRGAAQALIEETGKLDCICMTSAPGFEPNTMKYRTRQPGLPTWAPDWNMYPSALPLSAISQRSKASGNFQARVKFSAGGTILTAEGVYIDSVRSCSNILQLSRRRHDDLIPCVLEWRLFFERALGILPGHISDQQLEQFCRLILCEHRDAEEYLPAAKAWWSQWEAALSHQRSIQPLEFTQWQRSYLKFVFDCGGGRRLFSFENMQSQLRRCSKVGLCLKETAKGDLLVVLLGCKYPVILRPVDEYYVLIGDAFVPGLMQGRAVEKVAEGRRDLRSFELH